jgi:molecular chaperone HscA
VLGGDDFDHRLAAWFAAASGGGWGAQDIGALHAAARSAKEALTDA